jgi:hypothetical protein
MGVIEGAYDLRIHTGAPSDGTTEVQTLTIGATPTGGTFKLAFEGQITAAITWSATTNTLLANINTALRAIATIGASGITATEGSLSGGVGTVTLTFGGNLAKKALPLITVALNSLVGTGATLAITETTPGVDATERGAGTGAILVNITNGAVYVNEGTELEPTWTLIGTVADDSITAAKLTADAVTTAKILNANVTAAKLAANAVETAKIKDANVTEAKLEVGAAGAGLTGLVVKLAADANVIGAIPVIHRVAVASGANGNVDVALTHKSRVIKAWFVMKGAGTAGCTLQIQNVTTAISEAFDCSASPDKGVNYFATIDDAQHEIAAGANLRVVKASSGGDFPGAEVYVEVLRVA